MKTLYLIRHAKSSWEIPRLADFDRPLNDRGNQDAPEMGKRFAAKGIHPDLLVSSPALRAGETARKIAVAIGYPENEIEFRPGIYLAGIPELLEEIIRLPSETAVVFLIGHNPGLTDLTEYLTGTWVGNIPTCGTACIRMDGESWGLAGRGVGTLQYLDYPKKPFKS